MARLANRFGNQFKFANQFEFEDQISQLLAVNFYLDLLKRLIKKRMFLRRMVNQDRSHPKQMAFPVCFLVCFLIALSVAQPPGPSNVRIEAKLDPEFYKLTERDCVCDRLIRGPENEARILGGKRMGADEVPMGELASVAVFYLKYDVSCKLAMLGIILLSLKCSLSSVLNTVLLKKCLLDIELKKI